MVAEAAEASDDVGHVPVLLNPGGFSYGWHRVIGLRLNPGGFSYGWHRVIGLRLNPGGFSYLFRTLTACQNGRVFYFVLGRSSSALGCWDCC